MILRLDSRAAELPPPSDPHPAGVRLVYDLVANIAAEEYGHIELVAAAIEQLPAWEVFLHRHAHHEFPLREARWHQHLQLAEQSIGVPVLVRGYERQANLPKLHGKEATLGHETEGWR